MNQPVGRADRAWLRLLLVIQINSNSRRQATTIPTPTTIPVMATGVSRVCPSLPEVACSEVEVGAGAAREKLFAFEEEVEVEDWMEGRGTMPEDEREIGNAVSVWR